MELSQLCAANYHYKRYTLDYFLESAERLGYQSIELWASGPHLHLEDFDAARLAELHRIPLSPSNPFLHKLPR